ncbi:MAG: fused DSP-PTPase phosphatase/NAD kinase-like protein [Acidimicrobiia bacterium]
MKSDGVMVSSRNRPLPRRLAVVVGSFVAFLVVGNLVILGASAWAQQETPTAPDLPGVGNFARVDDKLWRGKAPTDEGYRSLAAHGVKTIVDLRAESHVTDRTAVFDEVGLDLVRLPIRDGQLPSAEQVEEFLAVTERPGRVFVHCGAGVGRAGTMAATYLVATGQADGWSAMAKNLAVGPPSFEQLAFAAGLDGHDLAGQSGLDKPGPLVVAVSRTLDAPRRIWHNLGF